MAGVNYMANMQLIVASPDLISAAIEALEALNRLAPNIVMDAKDSLRLAISKATTPPASGGEG